jgi:hypothetical protein
VAELLLGVALPLEWAGGIIREFRTQNIRMVNAPTSAELLKLSAVIRALEEAWQDSLPHDPLLRHEEGGWVYADVTTGAIAIRRAPAGQRALIDLNSPPVVPNSVVIATFHTHPNPSAEGWTPEPSAGDTHSAWALGVPCLVRADNGIHTTGPASRRGGLGGAPGYPA